ncbi:MAG TPA: hypothetical protein VMF08_12865 [Candidatus Sulfotelmatobacter sp.]|nr:hypothetical protein [Candidatus Sulfotelmatobacter sp.]
MRDDRDSNYISVGKWMLLILIPSIPVIGWILVIVLAFTGTNETRKNYFRAFIAWVLLLIVGIVAMCLVAGSPALFQQAKDWWAKHHLNLGK